MSSPALFFDRDGTLMEDVDYCNDPRRVAVYPGVKDALALAKKQGFKNLYQLKDGIHTYIKKYPGKNFKGSLFVFDNRMTTEVAKTPKREIIGQCFYCQTPSEDYYNDDSIRPSLKVICCNHCIKTRTAQLRKCVNA